MRGRRTCYRLFFPVGLRPIDLDRPRMELSVVELVFAVFELATGGTVLLNLASVVRHAPMERCQAPVVPVRGLEDVPLSAQRPLGPVVAALSQGPERRPDAALLVGGGISHLQLGLQDEGLAFGARVGFFPLEAGGRPSAILVLRQDEELVQINARQARGIRLHVGQVGGGVVVLHLPGAGVRVDLDGVPLAVWLLRQICRE